MYDYHPALRFKQGEYTAAWKVSKGVQDRIVPLFIIPPPKEHDPELDRVPTLDEIGYLTGERIGKHWPIRAAYLDTQYFADDLCDEGVERLFDVARQKIHASFPLHELVTYLTRCFKSLLLRGFPRLGFMFPTTWPIRMSSLTVLRRWGA